MIEAGAAAPEFRLSDQEGREHELAHYRGRWLVLYFYPKDDTRGCTAEACSFRDNMARITGHDAVVLGLSADDAESHRAFAEKYGLTFPLLVDPDRSAIDAYGAWIQKQQFGTEFMGVARMTYLIDPQGRVAHVWPQVEVEGHVDEVIGELERLRA